MKLLSKVWMLGIASLLGFTLIGCGSSSNLELKKDTFTVEYGEKISTNAKDYLKKDTDKEVLKDAKIAIKKLKNENDKEYPKVGKYDAVATYEDETKKFTIEVKDTVKPKFVDFAEAIEVEQGYSEDIATKFKASDLSEVSISADTSKVDFNVVGEYEIKVTAKDKYKNKTTKKAKVKVAEKKVEEKPAEQDSETTNNSVNNTTANNSPTNNNNVVSGGGNSSGGNNTGTGVCVPGTPNPAEIGNSGLLFYGNEAYYAWFDEMSADNGKKFIEIYGYYGWDGWTINFDTCGNPMTSIVWTVNFK